MNIQVIFQSKNGPKGEWLDYCREPSPHTEDRSLSFTNRWAKEQTSMLERREGGPFRFLVEIWP